ncbi:cytochrome c [Agaribacterium sp. ZY112]|uniref:c-type cytochrome n=1 Tax=Agaribacterium sp. ZY112 TaxID=3233574 RepID=UPI003523582C
MKKILSITALVFISLNTYAEKPAKEASCAACHGALGAKPITPLYPKLNGQNQAYLEAALKAYKAGDRKGGMAGVMAAQSTGLSDADIKALAAYYAKQK